MSRLDDRSYVERLDPAGMLRLTEEFPSQCRKALEIAQSASLPDFGTAFTAVVLTGLGGSAAGGDLTKALFDAQGSVPFIVNRDYSLPGFVGGGTLVIAVSYSGNTEETIAAYHDAKTRGASVIVVTSGGTLAELATKSGDGLIVVPGGQPPRTALGFLFVPVVVACVRLGLLPEQDFMSAIGLLQSCVEDWSVGVEIESNQAKLLALELYSSVGVIYGLGSWQATVANRWKGQINENSKNMAFVNAYPELCHNEILGWVKADDQGVARWVGVLLEDGSESDKMKRRAQVVEGLVEPFAVFHHVRAKGSSLLARMMSLTLFGDFVSLYLAALNEVDPENIDSINVLKKELALVK